jgi:hypothetical protein
MVPERHIENLNTGEHLPEIGASYIIFCLIRQQGFKDLQSEGKTGTGSTHQTIFALDMI